MKERTKEETASYHSQLLQHMFINTTLLEINARALDHIVDDLLVHVSDLRVRHLAWFPLLFCGG